MRSHSFGAKISLSRIGHIVFSTWRSFSNPNGSGLRSHRALSSKKVEKKLYKLYMYLQIRIHVVALADTKVLNYK